MDIAALFKQSESLEGIEHELDAAFQTDDDLAEKTSQWCGVLRESGADMVYQTS